ncbi:D-ribose pyranase [Ruminococcus gauvreauii]|uniref:D-ribose pyranase n=1 Tax=Ruminococcus gauvreauii TaxID=438033 RepID=A0ABY5VMX3_9FIRM|nr:D-ribose pyranase [Ruminococcus gauvreauii]UWP61115.1 D-ribose pyranase [Ruminococcus gauvreauii]
MKKRGILNRDLMSAIADMGHTEVMVIGDAGVPIGKDSQRIDLAVCEDMPTIQQVLRLIMDEMIYEKVVVAEEQKLYNPAHFAEVQNLSARCRIETLPHEKLFARYLPGAKYIVRTGDFMPWGNVVITAGIDAPKWFKKEGCMIPDYYEERAGYEE